MKYLLKTEVNTKGKEVLSTKWRKRRCRFIVTDEQGKISCVSKAWVLNHKHDIFNIGVSKNNAVYLKQEYKWLLEKGIVIGWEGDLPKNLIFPEGIQGISNTLYLALKGYCFDTIMIPGSVNRIWENTFKGVWVKEVIIEEGVEGIGSDAFYGCTALTSVKLPSTLLYISDYAFHNCISLQSVKLPDGLQAIYPYAFSFCRSLQSLSIPCSLRNIGVGAFKCCDSLWEVVIPSSVMHIEKYAFYDCRSLLRVLLSDGVEHIDAFAFGRCKSLMGVSIPKSVKYIDNYAFAACTSLLSVVSPQYCELGRDKCF